MPQANPFEHTVVDGDLPAFPTPDRGDGFQWPGMSLRDFFAAVALLDARSGVPSGRGRRPRKPGPSRRQMQKASRRLNRGGG